MGNTQTSTRTSSRPTIRPATTAVPIPQPRPEAPRAETHELRELLEAHLSAMQALLEEHRRTLARGLRLAGSAPAEVLDELRALGDHRAPWVSAIAETRALLYVALRELIVGDDAAGLSLQLAAQPRRVA